MQGPYFALIPVVGVVIFACWLLSVVTRNYSWVDRVWSIAPPCYVAYVAGAAGFEDPRLNLMALLTGLWGARLTYNFARKGGYRLDGEDYRWSVLRGILGPRWFQVFNATFIAPYQNVLIFLLTAPAHVAWERRGTPLGPLDLALAGLFLLLLVGETVADQQQWSFHRHKQAAADNGVAIDPPFCTTGLFSVSRHPNFFCEVSLWWVFYGFAVAASGAWSHWSCLGAVLLTMLFDGSTRFTEWITAGKYPAYAAYRRRVSRLVPWFPRSG